MFFTSLFSSFGRSFEMLVLSWTVHAKLARAAEPNDYDEILKHTIREVKFHSETLLTILFFLGTAPDRSQLISCTLASLLCTLLTYTALEAMSGDALHKRIDSFLHGRVLLALLAKLPAVSVLGTLCALAGTEWNTPYTTGVLCAIGGVLTIVLALRLKVHAAVARGFSLVVKRLESVVSMVQSTLMHKARGSVEEDVDFKSEEKGSWSATSSLADLPALPRAALLV